METKDRGRRGLTFGDVGRPEAARPVFWLERELRFQVFVLRHVVELNI